MISRTEGENVGETYRQIEKVFSGEHFSFERMGYGHKNQHFYLLFIFLTVLKGVIRCIWLCHKKKNSSVSLIYER